MSKETEFNCGPWSLMYDASKSVLSLSDERHDITGSFSLEFRAGDRLWQVGASRDGVPHRLCLLTPDRLVQGYVVMSCCGDSLHLRVIHRTAQTYHGVLSLSGKLSFADGFCCRVHPDSAGQVVHLGSGLCDSLTNNGIFDRERDRCLWFSGGREVRLTSLGGGQFALCAELLIQEPGESELVFTLEHDYYRRNYVSYYAPIDRKRCPRPPTGWMSWNVYFDQASAEDNLREAELGRQFLQPYGMEFWSMESWQADSDHLPVSSFDNLSLRSHRTQFPDGMAAVAQRIRSLGFRPGIWTAPYGTGSREFYEAHRDWFLHDHTGKPLRTWNGIYTIDPTCDEAVDWLREMHRTMAEEWGYDFFKIDGMSGRNAGYCAHFYELDEVRACFHDPSCPNPFERCVKACREGIGPNRIFLACQGHYTGPEAEVADASRIGADIVSPDSVSTWHNILSQAEATLAQMFVNNIVFWTDPDTLLVGDYRSLEEARVTAVIVSLPGQMMFSGDRLGELSGERMRLLQQALPVCDIHPLDLYPIFDFVPVWDLKIRRSFGRWDVVALFNWSEEEGEVGFAFSELGVDASCQYVVYEFFTECCLGVHGGTFGMVVPGHGVRLLAVHAVESHPQYLSSDRHFSQGGVDLEELCWDDDSRSLSGRVSLVGGHVTTLTFRVPAGYSLASTSSASCDLAVVSDCDGILRVSLRSSASCSGSFQLFFRAE